MELEKILTILISLAAVCVALYALFHKDSRDDVNDDKSTAVKIAEQGATLNQVLTNTTEIRLEQKGLVVKMDDLSERIVRVEESTKSAHKRIDHLEGSDKDEN